MITITAYHVTNGERSELIPYERTITDATKLKAIRTHLMQSHDNHRIDLIYHETKEAIPEPEPEPLVEVHVKNLYGVIERNKINLRRYVESMKS
jgi:hypothetical protein